MTSMLSAIGFMNKIPVFTKARSARDHQSEMRYTKMIARHERIINLFKRGQSLTIEKLMKVEKVSRATASKDLQRMEADGVAKFIFVHHKDNTSSHPIKLYSKK